MAAASVALLSGCGATASFSPAPAAAPTVSANGMRVMGGQQPIKGTHIQLYAVGTTGDGSSATALLQSNVTTSDGSGTANANANVGNSNNTLPAGWFTLNNLYSCPSQTALVYITATGGDAGSGTNNGIAEMAAIGPCGLLSTASILNINELTTVAAMNALQPYATSLTAIGSGASDAPSLRTAFALANELASYSTGASPGPGAGPGITVPSTTTAAPANAMAACVNTAGGAAGDGTPCGRLYSLTTISTSAAPTDTVTALLHIAGNPTQNVSSIFNLAAADAPFQPSLSSAPANWSIAPIQNTTPSPLIAPGAGSYTGTQTVTLLDAAPGASIYYTTDGTTASSSSTPYTGPFPLSTDTTINAIAVAPGSGAGLTSTAKLTIAPPPTTFPAVLNSSTVFIGASTVQFWPLPIHNAGVAGWTTSQVLSIFAANVTGHGYTRVVIDCGLNDVLDGASGMPTSAVNNIAAMADIASKAGMRVIIGTIQEPNPTGSAAGSSPGVDQLNVALKQWAQQNGYTVADFAAGIDGHVEDYRDYIHPNTAGYAVMESILSSVATY